MDTDPNLTLPAKAATFSNTAPVRVAKATFRKIKKIVAKCNRKQHGRKVKADDIIAKAISLLDDSHLEEIKALTFSSQDQIEIQFKKHCQTHGNISKDQFLKILIDKAFPGGETNNRETL